MDVDPITVLTGHRLMLCTLDNGAIEVINYSKKYSVKLMLSAKVKCPAELQ